MVHTATPATSPAAHPHQSILQHLAALLPKLEHLGEYVVKAIPVVISAGVHVSPQAQEAAAIVVAIDEAYKALRPATAPTPDAPSAEAPKSE